MLQLVTSDYMERALAFEELIKNEPQIQLQLDHYFSYGIYARALHIPAGTILTGEIHKFENLNILLQGKIRVTVSDEIQEIEAPFIIVSPPGTKRVAQAITHCLWVTIHGTHERNIENIKNQFIAGSYQEWLEFSGARQLELPLC